MGRIDLHDLLKQLGASEKTKLLVEGGREIFTAFLKENLADEIINYISPRYFGNDAKSCLGNLNFEDLNHAISFKDVQYDFLEKDIKIEGKINVYRNY